MATALITGASSGFGYETAKLLSKAGYKLILVARREEKLKNLAKELTTKTYISTIDVRDNNSIIKLFSDLPVEFRDIEVLVNNAGGALGFHPVDECFMDDWEYMVDVNIKGLMYFTHQTVPIMKKNNKGIIINIGSVAGHAPYKGGNVYGASKAFVSQFSKNLRTDLFGSKIKVTCIEPGRAETEFSVRRFKGDQERAKAEYEGFEPLTAEDIAETILWVVNRPSHVNIDHLEIKPVDQTWGGLVINRG
jgi:NADP-dependent 3-hydroxy acid dehydrogenase YdfG